MQATSSAHAATAAHVRGTQREHAESRTLEDQKDYFTGSDEGELDSDSSWNEDFVVDDKSKNGGIEDSVFDWFNPDTGTTMKAIRHDHCRTRFLQQQGLLGTYKHNPSGGRMVHDLTSYHPDYENCGAERSTWPRILFQLKPDDTFPDSTKPGLIRTQEGYVVLSNENIPLLDFPGIPLTLSADCEGWRLEAFCRLNKWASLKQIRGRMPGWIQVRLASLSMRMTRFRRKAAAISWDSTGGASDAIEAYIYRKLPQACKIANSTEAFRSLYPHEIAEMELENLGRFPRRQRGAKDVSVEKHQAMHRTGLKNYKKLLAKFKAENPDVLVQDGTADDPDKAEDAGKAIQGLGEIESKNTEGIAASVSHFWPQSDNQGNRSLAEPPSRIAPVVAFRQLELPRLIDSANTNRLAGSANKPDTDENASAIGNNGISRGGNSDEDSSSSISTDWYESEAGDFLYADPATEAEARLIRRLLRPTRHRYEHHLGLASPLTDPRRSYIYQWGDIATALSRNWDSSITGDPLPRLIGAVRFNSRELVWNLPWHNRFYGEPLRLRRLADEVFEERANRIVQERRVRGRR